LIRFTADRELYAQIQELKSLMRHQIPDGDVGKILAKAVAVLLKQVRARKFGECSAPRAARCERIVRTESAERVGSAERARSAERIESAERARSAERIELAERARSAERIESAERTEQAATPSPSRQIPAAIRRAVSKRDGERCSFVSATGRRCGSRDFLEFHHREPWARYRSHSIDLITLRCRAHNQYEAERDFGAKHMEHFCRRGKSEPAALLPEASALSLETETLRSHPNLSPAHQRELDLNPVGVR
jgi:5-methylcytosine-specific restriction endonuclease McrA